MEGRVEGKVAFITGIARGQGRTHAVRLAEEGADIIGVDVCAQVEHANNTATPEDLEQTIKEVEATGRRIIASQVDVRDLDALTAAVDAGVAELGRLDIVAANAAVAGFAPIGEMTSEQWQVQVDINLTGVFHTVKATLPHVRAGGQGGSMILTSSVAGLKPYANNVHYTSVKHGVVGMMRALALELAPEKIRVNCVIPGNTGTPMFLGPETTSLVLPELPPEEHTIEEFSKRVSHLHALPVAWVDPEDISNAVLFLASDEARYITGVPLPVDAGSLIK